MKAVKSVCKGVGCYLEFDGWCFEAHFANTAARQAGKPEPYDNDDCPDKCKYRLEMLMEHDKRKPQ
jgi:hypothetical protein